MPHLADTNEGELLSGLYFITDNIGVIRHCSPSALKWINNALGLSLADESELAASGSKAKELFQDPALFSRIIKCVCDSKQHLEPEALIRQNGDDVFCRAAVFVSQASGPDGAQALFFSVNPAASVRHSPEALKHLENALWEHIWSNTFSEKGLRTTISENLRLLGEYLDADRVYIVNKKAEDLPLKIDLEWCADGAEPIIDRELPSPLSGNCPPDMLFISWHTSPTHVHDWTMCPANIVQAFSDRHVRSLLVAPYCRNSSYSLYMVAESKTASIQWTEAEIKKFQNVAAFISSVIEYKRAETRKKGSEKALTTLLSHLETSIFLLHKKSGEILFANRAFMGFTSDDVIGKNCLNSNNPDLAAIFSALLKSEQDQAWTPDKDKLVFECFLPHQQRWLLIECEALSLPEGEDSLLCRALDITIRKEEESRLKRLAVTDAGSGALCLNFGLQGLHDALDTNKDSNKKLSLMCVALDNYQHVHSDSEAKRADELMALLVNVLQQIFGYMPPVIRLSMNELILYDPTLALTELREKSLIFREALEEQIGQDYSHYELSISLGLAEYDPRENSSVNSLIVQAKHELGQTQKENFFTPATIIL